MERGNESHVDCGYAQFVNFLHYVFMYRCRRITPLPLIVFFPLLHFLFIYIISKCENIINVYGKHQNNINKNKNEGAHTSRIQNIYTKKEIFLNLFHFYFYCGSLLYIYLCFMIVNGKTKMFVSYNS